MSMKITEDCRQQDCRQQARPVLCYFLTLDELLDLRDWVQGEPVLDLQSPVLANQYRAGVRHGLEIVEFGIASPLGHRWTDATGITWQWDVLQKEAVAVSADGSPVEPVPDSRDYIDYPDAEFTALARGLLDALMACGWK
ncbi:hypothetical protein BBC27_08765 [Acidithiobacillus ferrivorans]|uniref:Uncharacterized protein n=1 Tax=Acidithiobacillus ferrivorans TaxID=160808 RepID=A0A1B9BZX5_9PROT|nr:hypothetical protein [Acidithiobacillus ferrivorans]OCB03275.1 hypothetical protein BBC27_08765 [Acidithiobacillus ferrivorans]